MIKRRLAYAEVSLVQYDVALALKELASRMSEPTTMSFHHLKKLFKILEEDYGLLSRS